MKGFVCVCIYHWSLYKLGSTFTICQQSLSFQFRPSLEERKLACCGAWIQYVSSCHTVPAVRQRSHFFFSYSDVYKTLYIRSFQVTITKPTHKWHDLSQWTELAQKYSWVGEHSELDLKMFHMGGRRDLIEASGFNLSRLYRHASIWIHMCLPCGRVCTSQNPKQIAF